MNTCCIFKVAPVLHSGSESVNNEKGSVKGQGQQVRKRTNITHIFKPSLICSVLSILSLHYTSTDCLVYLTLDSHFCSSHTFPSLIKRLLEIVLVLPIILVGLALAYIYDILWLRLEKIRNKLRRQGINGPKPTVLYGNTQEMKRIRQEIRCVQRQDTNMNSYISIIFPHFLHWRKTYGMYRILVFACLFEGGCNETDSMVMTVYFILESQ